MRSLRERRRQRIDRDVRQQTDYVVGSIQEQIDAGQEPPYVAYARVRSLTPEDTARDVGQAVIGHLGESFMLDAKVAEEAGTLFRDGAIIRLVSRE